MKMIAVFLFLLFVGDARAADLPASKPGFEKQILDITYGEVWRPTGWYYAWSTTQSGVMWTVSKEDARSGAYDTGMRIQLIITEKTATKDARQLAKDFIAHKIASAKVERLCDEKPNGEFRQICLETTEPSNIPGKPYRILYSVSWSSQRGWVVVTTFGAPDADWDALRPTVDAMTQIVLIGGDFYKNHKKSAPPEPAK